MPRLPLFPESASNHAPGVDAIMVAMTVVGGGVSLIIAVLLVWFAVRYRAGSSASRVTSHRHTWLVEATWIVLPMLILVGVFLWAARMFYHMQRPPADTLDLYVIGRQWMWKAQHPGGQREINALHVPLGTPVRLTLTSQDVIHSFYIPAFRIKMDAVPGRYTSMWFTPTRVGEYHIFCAEFCGTDHARMIGRITVLEPANYQRWLGPGSLTDDARAAAPVSMARSGRGAFFQLGCNACHVPDSTLRAPRLEGLFGSEVALRNNQSVIANEDYLRESILRPNARIVAGYPSPSLMPVYQGQVSHEQMNELVEYIKSLSFGEASPPAAPPGSGPGVAP
jgi:cytochrome c oxidase subunit 2